MNEKEIIFKYPTKLYAIINTKDIKFETTLTSPGHKFWESKQRCKTALENYTRKYNKSQTYKLCRLPDPKDLKIVQFNLELGDFVNE